MCFLAFIFLLTACEPKATPFPAEMPTEEPTTPAQIAQPGDPVQIGATIRYGLAFLGLPVPDIEQIQAASEVTLITDTPNPNDIGTTFDLLAAYGDLPGGTRSPVSTHVSLVLNRQRPPLDAPEIAGIIRRSLNPTQWTANLAIAGVQPEALEIASTAILRTELANSGWPDGFDVVLTAFNSPITSLVAGQLNTLGIGAQPIPLTDAAWTNAQMALVMWATPEDRAVWVERAGDEALVIDLLTIPISYWAVNGLNITFTPGGWPLATR